jgi:hypothetical protein
MIFYKIKNLLESFKHKHTCSGVIQHHQELRLDIIIAGSLYKMSDSIKEAQSLTLRGELNSKDLEAIRNLNKLDILNLCRIKKVKQIITNSLPQASIEGMKRLRVLVLPELITTDALAVISCRSLREVIIPQKLEILNSGIVYDCRNFNRYVIEEGNMNFSESNGVLLSKDGTKLLSVPCGMKGTYRIPDSVTEIVGGAFLGCTQLNQVLSDKVLLKVANNAFYGCRCSPDIGRDVGIRPF